MVGSVGLESCFDSGMEFQVAAWFSMREFLRCLDALPRFVVVPSWRYVGR
jgi:hypothetical protein